MNVKERQIECVISTKKDLEELLRQALDSGVLDLENCQVKVDFNLAELLLACGIEKKPIETDDGIWDTLECPFTFNSKSATFEKEFIACDFGTKTIFTRNAYFTHTTFSGIAYFTNTTFTSEVDFTHTNFSRRADFRCTTFSGIADFTNTAFKRNAYFWRATFSDIAYFINTTFSRKADFYKASFSGLAYFADTTFEKHTSFKEIILENAQLNFDHATTHDYLGIVPNELNGEIIIKDTSFESDKRSLVVDLENCLEESTGNVQFENIEVDSSGICIKVRNLKKESKVTVHFKECGFYGKNVVFTKVAMQQVSITGGSYVAGMGFYLCKWDSEKALECFKFLPFWLKFRAFKKLNTTDTLEKIESYGYLKVSALDAGDAQLSNDFHFWHQFYQNKWFSWNTFYLWTSAYGLSAMLPLLWFFIVVCFGFLYYRGNCFWDPLWTSLSASFPLILYKVEPIQNAIKTVATKMGERFYLVYILQHLIQGYLLFQIGAAIRNKVKR